MKGVQTQILHSKETIEDTLNKDKLIITNTGNLTETNIKQQLKYNFKEFNITKSTVNNMHKENH